MDDDPQIDLHHLLDEGHEDDEAGALDPGEAAERENHAALIFAQDADRRGQEDDGDHRDEEVGKIIEHRHGGSPSAAAASGRRRTIRVRPLTDATSTVSPGAKGSSPRACQRSH